MINERRELAMERIKSILEDGDNIRFHDFFISVSKHIIRCDEFYGSGYHEKAASMNMNEWREYQKDLYHDMLPENYDTSYLNYTYAHDHIDDEVYAPLCALYAEAMTLSKLGAMGRMEEAVKIYELFLEVYGACQSDEKPERKILEDIIYWYASDYLDETVPYRIGEILSPGYRFIHDIIMDSDLSNLRYLYKYGDYISDTEIKVATYLNSLSEEVIDKMADTWTEGFRQGFIMGRKDISKKQHVAIRYQFGYERVIKRAVENFKKMGLDVIFTTKPYRLTDKSCIRNVGCAASSINKQYEHDHRYDSAIFYKKAYTDRKLDLTKTSYEQMKDQAEVYAGPAVMETFGEASWEPKRDEYAYQYDDKQKELLRSYNNDVLLVQNTYIPSDETSFTIIAWPVPDIGDNFDEVFKETISINTLPQDRYMKMQQTIIDVLDKASHVEVMGAGSNDTELYIKLKELSDPEHETIFENCVADVNIPLGEVFTSPVLKGTSGLLHVSKVYIGDVLLKDLRIWFKDGMIDKYSCANYQDDDQCKRLVEENILKEHETLAMGEFAIGTNTTAYAVARRLGIISKLPILIVEKMGPHFAVGDTCYSFEEDVMTYNPDGKAIVARDNEVSKLRKTDINKAYYGCHTDITIPYDEIGRISAVLPSGDKVDIILNGRFVLKGVEELNVPLDALN